MPSIELKRKLIKEIELSSNQELLTAFYRFLNRDNGAEEIYVLNADQKGAVREGRANYRSGKYLDNGSANDQMDTWLEEQSGHTELRKIEETFLSIGTTEISLRLQ